MRHLSFALAALLITACSKAVVLTPVAVLPPEPSAAPTAAPITAPRILTWDHGRGAEFDLVVDGTSYAVAPDQPFQIELASGRRSSAVLHRRKLLTFADYGIHFNYPSDLKLSVDEEDDLITIELKGIDSLLVTVRIDKDRSSSPKATLATMAAAMRSAFNSTESGTPIKRRLGSTEVEGLELSCSVLKIDLQAMRKDGSVILVMFQRLADDTGLAASQFGAIAASLE